MKSRNLFIWFLSTLIAVVAAGMHYTGLQIPFGNVLLAGSAPLDLMLIAYLILWVSGVMAGG